MNLSAKLTLIFSGIILLMGSVSFYGIYSFQNDILEQEISEKLENAASAHLDKLDRMFFERLEDLDILSSSSIISSKNSSAEQVHRELEKFINRYPQYASVSFFDMNRIRIASSGSSKLLGKQHSLTEYWPAIYAGQDHIVNISKSESLLVPTVHLVDRVKDSQGTTIGVVVARVPVEGLYELVDEKKDTIGDAVKYKVDILDPAGIILYSNHNKQGILNEVDDDFELIKKQLPSVQNVDSLTHVHRQSHGAENPNSEELMVFAKEQGFRSFKGNGWILKIEYASKTAFAPVAALSKKVSILLLSISLIAIAVILSALLLTVVRPLKKLSSATIRLGKGELETTVDVESSDEIGKLAESFNDMAASLKSARQELAHAAENALARASLAERKIISVSEETQQRIGRELHDDLGQQLTGIAFMSEVLSQRLKKQGSPDAREASRITALVNEAISKTRQLAHGLYPVEMKESGLHAMLVHLAGSTESIYRTECEFICEGENKIDDPLAITNLFRIAQEAVNNAVKHSGATKIILKMISTADSIFLEVADNGCGIGNLSDLQMVGGLGMHTMQYRASLLGATLGINRLQGGGTSVTVNLSACKTLSCNEPG